MARWLALVALLVPQEGLRNYKVKEAIVKANTSKEIAEAVAARINNFCAVFEQFYADLGLDKRSDNKLVARLFDTYEEYETHYRRTTSEQDPPLAYFSPSLNAIVLYNDEADLTLRQTLFHESAHQYLNRFTSDAPKWLNEGLSEYFEGWRMSPEGKLVEKRVNLFDLKLLQDCLKAEKALAPRALAAFDHQQFNDFRKNNPGLHPYLHYVSAWGMVYFSLELSSEPRDRERIVAYLRALNDKGASARFHVEDWDDFETRWKAALLGLEAVPVDAVDFVLLASGYRQSGDYAEATKLYEAALAKDPKTPRGAYLVGSAKKRMGDYAGALEWLEKARAAEPADPSAPYLMARILLGIDRKGSKKEETDPVRALALAQEASKLAGGDSPQMLELLARCQAANGDASAAEKTVKKILKLVEEEEKPYYEQLAAELKGK